MNKFDYKKYFFKKDKKGKIVPKKITLMGLGGFPRSLIEAEFLAKLGVDLIITDLTPKEKLKKELKKLEKYKNIRYTLGKHKISDFKNRDIVFSANGVPLGNKYIEASKKYSKITTKTVAFLFYILQKESEEKNLNIKTIGVTGTKGKSTTTAMIFHLLKTYLEEKNEKDFGKFLKDFAEGKILQKYLPKPLREIKNPKKLSKEEKENIEKYFYKKLSNNAFTCGNVRGTANLPILSKIKAGDFVVAEIDSWLAQGFGGLKISPHISVFTNLYNDHQNYYHSMQKYFDDKSFIFKFQKKDDLAVFTNNSAQAYKNYFNKKIKAKKVIARAYKLPRWDYTVFGKHNYFNIAQALEVAKFLKISKKVQKKAFENYVAEEGRLQKLTDKKDIIFYNDNNATMPEASIISLNSVKERYPKSKIFLLAGGADKEFDLKNLSRTYEEIPDFTVYFEGTGTKKLLENFSKKYLSLERKKTENRTWVGKEKFQIVDNMKEAFYVVTSKASKGDLVMLSPGMASFGCFKNEYDKNDQFLREYRKF